MDGSGSKPGVPLAACLRSIPENLDELVDGVPHDAATFVHIAVGIPNNLDVGVKLKASQHLATRLTHQGLCALDSSINFLNGCLDE